MVLPNPGTATFTNGSKAVTGTDTLFTLARAGDRCGRPGIGSAHIESVESDTALTLVDEWGGADATDVPYELIQASDPIRYSNQNRETIEKLNAVDANRHLFFNLISDTGGGDPGAGRMSFNNATLSSVTEGYFDALDANSTARDVSALLDLWTLGTIVLVRSVASAAYVALRVSVLPTGSGYRQVGFEYVGSSGSLTAEAVSVSWIDAALDLAIDAVGEFTDLSTYDDEAANFVFLSTDGDGDTLTGGVLFIKNSATSADWSDPVEFQGPVGPTGPASVVVGTSSTAITIGTGSKGPFTTQAGVGWSVGTRLKLVSASNAANFMVGLVTAYSGTDLTVTVDHTGGSGSISDWNISIAGERGAAGAGDLSSSNNLSEVDPDASRANLKAAHRMVDRRNRVVNGAHQISQENGDTEGTTEGYYFADQWYLTRNLATGVAGAKRVASVSPAGSPYRGQIKVNTAQASIAAGEYVAAVHPIEGSEIADALFGTADAVDFVVRLFVNRPAGTYPVVLQNAAGDRSYVREFTISGGQAETNVVVEVVFPGCPDGTWPTGEGVLGAQLFLPVAVGSTFQTTADAWQTGDYLGTSSTTNGMATVDDVHQFGDVGSKADPDEVGEYGPYEVPDPVAEKRKCQRFLPVFVAPSGQPMLGDGMYNAATLAVIKVPVGHLNLAKTPTGLTLSDPSHFAIYDGATFRVASDIAFGNTSKISVQINVTTTSSSQYRPGLLYSNNAAAKLIFTGCRL